MKKDFFEIMKNYNPEIKSFSVSSENIKEKAMQKIGKSKEKKKFDFRRVFTSIPAIVAVGLMVGTGVIAYELSTLDRAVQFYEEHPYASQTINENDKEVINNLLKAETTIVESNGATMELTGSMYDENTMLLFFKLTAPENIVLDQDRYEFADWMFNIESNSNGGGAGGALFFNDTDKTDNIIYFTYEINCHGFKAEDFTDIHFEDLCYVSDGKYEFSGDTVTEGEWLIPLNLSTPSEILYLLDEPIKVYNSERYYRIDDIKISSLSLMITGSYWLNNVDISVIMKDGSIIDEVVDSGGGSNVNGFTNIYSFGKPIELSHVKSIKLNDTEISVEDKYAEKYGSSEEATEPDTTGMTEIYAGSSYIPTTETEDIVRLKSIKMDNENIAIALTSNAIQDTMTIITKDNQTELIPFGNGTDADDDGIYTEIHQLRNEYNPEDIVSIEIVNSGVRLDVAGYMSRNN